MELCGKPLIAYTIETALNASRSGRVVVSTDDPDIASVARAFGAEVPFMRPSDLGTDQAIIGDAVNHMSRTLLEQGYRADIIVTLYPTHPFRTSALIDRLIGKILEGYDQVYTGKRIYPDGLPEYIRPDGSVLEGLPSREDSFIRLTGTFLGSVSGPMTTAWLHVAENPMTWIDIDYIEDFKLAEAVIREGRFDFEKGDIPDTSDSRIS
jgi:hypothetical protein